MANLFQPQERLPSTDLDPEDLQAIVDSIDDHLAFRNVVYNDSARSREEDLPVSLASLSTISDWLKMSSAPLYPSQGVGGARGTGLRAEPPLANLDGNEGVSEDLHTAPLPHVPVRAVRWAMQELARRPGRLLAGTSSRTVGRSRHRARPEPSLCWP